MVQSGHGLHIPIQRKGHYHGDWRGPRSAGPRRRQAIERRYVGGRKQEKIGAWDSLTIGLIEYPLLKAIYFDTIINTLYLFDVDSCISVIDDHNIFYQHKGAGLVSLSKADRSLRLERESIFRETGGIKSVRRKFYDKSKKLIGGKIGHIMVDEKSSISVQTKVGWDYCTNYFGLSKSNGS